MHPIFLDLGFIKIHWYGVMAALAAMSAFYTLIWNRKYAGLNKDQAADIIFYCVLIGGVVGARIFYVLLNWSSFAPDPWPAVIRIDQGGLVFYGGFFLSVLLIILYCRRHKLSVIGVFDVMAPSLAIGHGISRIGCFLQGCCYGRPTDFFLGVKYPVYTPEIPPDYINIYPGLAVHPVQLYECLGNILLGLFFIYLLRRGVKRGVTVSCYFIGYGMLRFLDEFLRGDHPASEYLYNLSPAQVIGVGIIPVGVILLIFFLRGKNPLFFLEPSPAEPASDAGNPPTKRS